MSVYRNPISEIGLMWLRALEITFHISFADMASQKIPNLVQFLLKSRGGMHWLEDDFASFSHKYHMLSPASNVNTS